MKHASEPFNKVALFADVWQNTSLVPLNSLERYMTPDNPLSFAECFDLNKEQRNFESLFFEKTNSPIVVNAPAGTGKTYMALVAILQNLLQGRSSNVLYVTSNVYATENVVDLASKIGYQLFSDDDLLWYSYVQPNHNLFRFPNTYVESSIWLDRQINCIRETIAELNLPEQKLLALPFEKMFVIIQMLNKRASIRKIRNATQIEDLQWVKQLDKERFCEIVFLKHLNTAYFENEFYTSVANTTKQQIMNAQKNEISEHFRKFPTVKTSGRKSITIVDKENINELLEINESPDFDYVILDEAHAISVAEAIPIIFRGNKTILLGDSAQIEPNTKNVAFKNAESLYKQSIFGYLKKVRKVNLKKHYRCVPELINFSSINYYENKLEILTRRPHSKSVSSFTEISSVEESIVDFIEEFQQKGTVGVFMADNDLVTKITKYVYANVNVEEKANLKIDTVETFSGGERDYIAFIVPNEEDMQNSFYDCPKQVNVMATRGKYGLKIFSVVPHKKIGVDTEFSKLVNYIIDTPKFLDNKPENSWVQKIGEALDLAGYYVNYHTIINEKSADIVVGDIDKTIIINATPETAIYNKAWFSYDFFENRFGNNIENIVEHITSFKSLTR